MASSEGEEIIIIKKDTLDTGDPVAHENEALGALSSLRHKEKFPTTALPVHTCLSLRLIQPIV